MTKRVILFSSIIIGSTLVLFVDKWFYIGLLLIYIPFYLIVREFHPAMPKEMRELLKKKPWTLEEVKAGIKELGRYRDYTNLDSRDLITSLIENTTLSNLQPFLIENKPNIFEFKPNEALLGFGSIQEILEVCKEIYILTKNVFGKHNLGSGDQNTLRSYGERIALLSFYLWRTGKNSDIPTAHNHLQTSLRQLLVDENNELLAIIGEPNLILFSRYSDGIGRNLSRRDRQVVDETIHNKFKSEVTIKLDNKSTEICHAYIIHLLHHVYMFHVWVYPKFKLGWHQKNVATNKLFWIEKYS